MKHLKLYIHSSPRGRPAKPGGAWESSKTAKTSWLGNGAARRYLTSLSWQSCPRSGPRASGRSQTLCREARSETSSRTSPA